MSLKRLLAVSPHDHNATDNGQPAPLVLVLVDFNGLRN
jgi:hypothetical protein